MRTASSGVVVGDHAEHRAEDLLAGNAHVVGDVAEDRRLDVPAPGRCGGRRPPVSTRRRPRWPGPGSPRRGRAGARPPAGRPRLSDPSGSPTGMAATAVGQARRRSPRSASGGQDPGLGAAHLTGQVHGTGTVSGPRRRGRRRRARSPRTCPRAPGSPASPARRTGPDPLARRGLPVKATLSIPGCVTRCSPTSRPPGTMLTTPAGTPASSSASARMNLLRGVSGAGLTTTVQPAASAGATLHGPA